MISLRAGNVRHTVGKLSTRVTTSLQTSSHKKLCALEVARVPTVAISGLPLASPMTKSHLDVAPVERRKVYYMGEGGGFPQVWALVSLVNPKLHVARPSTKGVPKSELTNLWLVGCKSK